MQPDLPELLALAANGEPVDAGADRTSRRLLDAAVQEAAAVGLGRLTVEDVVRRAGVARMTAYRRYPRRDDLVQALIQRETQRFLAAVADAIDDSATVRDGVTAAFVAAVAFAREHPMLRRAGHTDPGGFTEAVAADGGRLLDTGTAFIARYLHGERPGSPSRDERWVAGVLARLFLSFVALPPGDPDLGDDRQLRRFAHEVLAPMVERVVPAGDA